MASLYKTALHFFYPPLCVHCREITPSHREMLCASCLSFLSLVDLQGRCLTCFTHLDGRLCPICSRRERLISRQVAAVEKMGPAATLLFSALSGDRSVFPAMGALMAYQWTRLSFPLPDLIVPISCSRLKKMKVGFDAGEYLAKLVGKIWDIPSICVLRSQWDRETFLTEGIVTSRFLCKNTGNITDKTVLLLSLDDSLIQKAAKALQPLFPREVASLSFV